MNVQFPVRQADGSQYTNADELCAALASESGGHYLLGAHGCWHGGIHISDASAPQCVQQEPVRCIADGEVVAYRLNQDYLTSTFAGTAETNTLQYSSSFCLVRHHYQSPANASEGPEQGQTNQLTFYSLYMHLTPYAAYAQPTEATVQQDLSPREQPGYWQGEVVATSHHRDYARFKPRGDTAERFGLITVGSVMRYHTSTVQPIKVDGTHQVVAECHLISGSRWDSGPDLESPFWTGIEDRFVSRQPVVPTEFDRVISCQVPIKAGDPVGYLGLYETPAGLAGGKDSQHQVHLEVFSCEANLDGYLKNPAGLTDGKQYLQIASGQQLYSKGGTEAAPTFLPQGRPTTQAFIIEQREASQHREANGKEWFGVTLHTGNRSLEGFVAKDEVQCLTAHDREKLGFKIIREENENADGLIDVEQMPEFFRQLHRDIDAKGKADGQVTTAELQAAQRDPALRQRWMKLIAYHPTEWQAKSHHPKWQSLKELLKESPEVLRHESERIDHLVFWDELTEATGVALPKQIYHFHPLEFIRSVQSPRQAYESLWREYQQRAEAIVAPGGNLIADPMARNRAINAAYAELWLSESGFQWAGLAAFASKQVGCGLLHAAESLDKMQAEYAASEHRASSARQGVVGLLSGSEELKQAKLREFEQRQQDYERAERDNPVPYGWTLGADVGVLSFAQSLFQLVYEMLAMGNTSLFLDVYPLHMFYKEQGLEELQAALPLRINIHEPDEHSVLWPVPQGTLEFGTAYKEILLAFEAIEAGNIADSVESLARHEQVNILQPVMYNHTYLKWLLRGNHASYVTNFPSGVAQAIELTLASQCRPVDDGRTIGFDSSAYANLADIDQRMAFVLKAAAQFDQLLQSDKRQQIEQSIRDIAAGGGVR